MKLFLIGALLVVGATAQIYTVKGPDGYKYPRPQAQARINVEEVAEACPNGGTGEYCCTNGANNADCQLESFNPPTVNEVNQESFEQISPELPPLPSFVPAPALPSIIPVKKIVASSPAPFAVQGRSFEATTSLNEYLPPVDYLPPTSVRFDDADSSAWDSWKAKYSKRYANPEEDRYRRQIFEGNSQKIDLHNLEFEAGSVTYDLYANKFADLTQDEFAVIHTGLKRDRRMSDSLNVFMPSPMLDADVDDEVDWRKKGAVTPVKNQGSCASCWAFAANGALESQNFLKTGKLVSLSEQNLIDCVKENDGCLGGYMTNAYDYVRTNPGVDTEASYPYEQKNSTCRFDPANVGGECIAHMEIMIGNEVALKQAVATVGPVAAGIDGAKHSFQFYKSGYYFEPNCDEDVNHAVVIVGYGTTDAGEEYWICKNSWDTDWGEEGYIRMARNKNNHCGITSLASYPLV